MNNTTTHFDSRMTEDLTQCAAVASLHREFHTEGRLISAMQPPPCCPFGLAFCVAMACDPADRICAVWDLVNGERDWRFFTIDC